MSGTAYTQILPAAAANGRVDPFMLPFRGTSAKGWASKLRLAGLVFFAWTAVGLFQTVPEIFFSGFMWHYFLGKLIEAWTWALLTPAILLVDRKIEARQPNVFRLSALHLILSVPFSLVQTYLSALFEYFIPQIWWSPLRTTEFAMYYFLGGWMTYCAVVGILQAFRYYNQLLKSKLELERLGKRLVETRLNALRLQLEPHFLFNTLNAISSEAAENPKLAREMIDDLGTLLRRSLDCQASNEITMAEELALLDRYLAIQRLRFGDRISISIDVDPASLTTMVPSLLLQPLVENAIRHGIEGRLSGGAVAITAQPIGKHLRIEVTDDGVGLPPRWRIESCAGLGIRVTQERLEALYSGFGEHAFTVSRRRGGGTKVTICIPLQGGSESHEAARPL